MNENYELGRKVVGASRAWYGASIADFLETQPAAILGGLASSNEFALLQTQKDAWLVQIELLKKSLGSLTGSLFLEFNIPRMGRRISRRMGWIGG